MKTVVSAAAATVPAVAATNNTANINSTSTATVVSIVPKTEPIGPDEGMQFQAPLTSSTPNAGNKRPVSLDLNKSTAKKRSLIAPLLIDSPDIQNMNKTLNTPDLEKILLAGNMQTPQPGTVFPTKVGPVTTEQEEFGKGFEEALHNLHNSSKPLLSSNNASNNSVSVTNTTTNNNSMTAINVGGMSGGSFTYTSMENFPVIKDEPQNGNSTPPVSPIDMETQEKIKLERKRQRNRVAASKCRKRKLERISKLEDKVKILKGENGDLAMIVKSLKDHVAQLKQQVMEHLAAGCNVPPINNEGQLLQSK